MLFFIFIEFYMYIHWNSIYIHWNIYLILYAVHIDNLNFKLIWFLRMIYKIQDKCITNIENISEAHKFALFKLEAILIWRFKNVHINRKN